MNGATSASPSPWRARAAPVAALLFVACAATERAAPRSTTPTTATTPTRAEDLSFAGLGDHHRPITGVDAEAQRLFDQGMAFLYAFNHDEAIRFFTAAAARAPTSAMPRWALALAAGPHINQPFMSDDRSALAWRALLAARARQDGASPVERALIDALGARYAERPPADRSALDAAYADAMRDVRARFPSDADVAALFAEALMDLRPWDLWTNDGRAQPGTDEIVSVLDAARALDPQHPLALHLTIHALEASTTPERAVPAADALRSLTPGLGHLVHMPSHIDVRVGAWAKAIEANEAAIEADRRWSARAPRPGFYALYMAHNHHMLGYAASMIGRRAAAIAAMERNAAAMPKEFVDANPAIADGYLAMPLEMLVRFGRWEEILALPDFEARFPFARALRFAARAIAYAAQGDVARAQHEQNLFIDAKGDVPQGAMFGNNRTQDLLRVASRLVDGEVKVAAGDVLGGVTSLRDAVAAEDALRYDEPPDWIQPARHALGAVLVEHGHFKDAEVVYQEDLARLPNNGWSLYGLGRALRGQGKDATDVERRFATAWEGADLPITSSCLCRPGAAPKR